MDESTRQKMELKKEREQEIDAELQYLQFYKENDLKLTFQDIIEFAWQCGFKGIARSITKRKFIDELCESKIKCFEFEIEPESELEKYNYSDR